MKATKFICSFAPGLVLIFTLATTAFSQPVPVGTTSLQFLKIEANARAAGMSGAVVSNTRGSNAAFWNPAGLARVARTDVSFGYTQYLFDTYLSSFSAVLPVRALGTSSIALYGLYMDYGSIQETREDLLQFNPDGSFNPGLTGRSLNPSSMYAGISFARSLTHKFSLGISARYLREDLVEEAVDSWCVDAGFIFYTGLNSINVGVALRNFGPEVQFGDFSYPIPMTVDLGMSAYLIAPEDALLMNMGSHSLLMSGGLQHPRDDAQQFKLGLEYNLNETIYLRAGKKYNYDTERIAFGCGLRLSHFYVDYAYSDFGEYLESVNRFTFMFRF